MMKINRSIIDTLKESNQRNVLTSPIWSFKAEKIVHQGKYYVKTYLYQTEEVLNNLKEVRFSITFISSIEQSVYEFKKVDSIDDKNAFGCLIELPIEYAQKEFKNDFNIEICSYIIHNTVVELPKNQFNLLRYDINDTFQNRRTYIKESAKNYAIDPYLGENYWMCS